MFRNCFRRINHSKLTAGLVGCGLTAAPILSVAAPPPSPAPDKRIKLINEEHVLIPKAQFDTYFRGISDLVVVTGVGNYNSGKSTLLNELFFPTERPFPQHQNVTVTAGLTHGIHGVLTSIKVPRRGYSMNDDVNTKERDQAVLVVDSEGLFSVIRGSSLVSRCMSMRTLAISDVLVVNFLGAAEVSGMKELASARQTLVDKIPNLDPAATRRPLLPIVFSQRLTNPLDSRDPTALFGTGKVPAGFETPIMIESLTKAPNRGNGVVLLIDELFKQIKTGVERFSGEFNAVLLVRHGCVRICVFRHA
jgi:hypothetical protein